MYCYGFFRFKNDRCVQSSLSSVPKLLMISKWIVKCDFVHTIDEKYVSKILVAAKCICNITCPQLVCIWKIADWNHIVWIASVCLKTSICERYHKSAVFFWNFIQITQSIVDIVINYNDTIHAQLILNQRIPMTMIPCNLRSYQYKTISKISSGGNGTLCYGSAVVRICEFNAMPMNNGRIHSCINCKISA